MLELRPALAEEAQALTAIALAAKRSWGYPEAVVEQWRPQLTVPCALIAAQPTWVATVERTLAGFYSVAPADPCWRLDHLWVLPAWMGRRIGYQLLEHALTMALKAAAEGLDIDADPNAEGFYLRCGARRISEVPAPIQGSPHRRRPQLRLLALRADQVRCAAPRAEPA